VLVWCKCGGSIVLDCYIVLASKKKLMTAGAVTHLADLHDQGTGNSTVLVCSHIEHQCTHLRVLVGVLLSGCGGGCVTVLFAVVVVTKDECERRG
jgi:hypothetical protein